MPIDNECSYELPLKVERTNSASNADNGVEPEGVDNALPGNGNVADGETEQPTARPVAINSEEGEHPDWHCPYLGIPTFMRKYVSPYRSSTLGID